ncbi:MAG: hypothetical protein D6699_07185 [Aquificota bacterium]|nr:MAG: hypothetical protein D6699_07185 [Aquificota bacterium]
MKEVLEGGEPFVYIPCTLRSALQKSSLINCPTMITLSCKLELGSKDKEKLLNLMKGFSSVVRFAYSRLLENRGQLWSQGIGVGRQVRRDLFQSGRSLRVVSNNALGILNTPG